MHIPCAEHSARLIRVFESLPNQPAEEAAHYFQAEIIAVADWIGYRARSFFLYRKIEAFQRF
jgi:hypothetical protein